MPTNLLQESSGIPRSLLEQITCSDYTVKEGWKYLAMTGEIRTGTLVPDGTTAITSDVLGGKTFYSNSWVKQSGTMVNRGAWVGQTNGEQGCVIPAGYHNGSGVVNAHVWDYGRFLYLNIFYQGGYGDHDILEGCATLIGIGNGHYPAFYAHDQNLNNPDRADICGAGMLSITDTRGNTTITTLTRVRNIFGPDGTWIDYDAGYQFHFTSIGSPHYLCFCKI